MTSRGFQPVKYSKQKQKQKQKQIKLSNRMLKLVSDYV